MFTEEEIERWINELGEQARNSGWGEVYKFAWYQALVAVQAKMDDAKRASTNIKQENGDG